MCIFFWSCYVTNIHEDDLDNVPQNFPSFEYSYAQAKPRHAKLPIVKATRRPNPTNKCKQKYNDQKEKEIIHRLLGIFFNNNGDSSQTGKVLVNKAKEKMANGRIPKGGPSLAALITNTYYVPTINWSPIMARINPKELNKLDSQLTRTIKGHFGLTMSDSAISLMRPRSCFGGGITSFTGFDLRGNARELETTLANPADVGIALRASLELTNQLPSSHKSKNTRAITFSINKLAKFGIYLRDG